MRRALKWVAGGLGLAALARSRGRRHERLAGIDEADYAGDLRRKLAEQRTTGAPAGAIVEEPPESAREPSSPATADLEARRARVHERAQAAIDLMRDADRDRAPEGDGGA